MYNYASNQNKHEELYTYEEKFLNLTKVCGCVQQINGKQGTRFGIKSVSYGPLLTLRLNLCMFSLSFLKTLTILDASNEQVVVAIILNRCSKQEA